MRKKLKILVEGVFDTHDWCKKKLSQKYLVFCKMIIVDMKKAASPSFA